MGRLKGPEVIVKMLKLMSINFCFGAHPSALKNNQVSQFSTPVVCCLHTNNTNLLKQERHKIPLHLPLRRRQESVRCFLEGKGSDTSFTELSSVGCSSRAGPAACSDPDSRCVTPRWQAVTPDLHPHWEEWVLREKGSILRYPILPVAKFWSKEWGIERDSLSLAQG